MIPREWRGCFESVSDAKALRIIEAMDGLPHEVLAAAQRHIRFVCPPGPITASRMGRIRGYARITIVLHGVHEHCPYSPLPVWHELAHAFAGHTYRPFTWIHNRVAPKKMDRLRKMDERQAWRLVAQWARSALRR